MTTDSRHQLFGKRETHHTVIIARGDTVRHFTVRPWLARTAMLTALGVAVGGVWVGARAMEPEIGPFRADVATVAASYELRIASLRSEVDRLTTRGFLDRQKMSTKVDILLEQQAELAERYAQLKPLLDRARSSGLIEPVKPKPKPSLAAADVETVAAPLAYAAAGDRPASNRFKLLDRGADARSAVGGANALSAELINEIGQSIDEVEATQIQSLDHLTSVARAKTEAIGDVLKTEGIGRLVLPSKAGGEGGPYVPVPADQRFEAGVVELTAALDLLEGAHDASRALPLAAPVVSNTISSTFGVREDPFLGKAAMHTGIDFVAETGKAVEATAAGTVTFAGDNGGYGRMVEIDHGNGLSTRYGHLSEIAVAVGSTVVLGATVGRVGSTGRSTGAHLHYEVRRAGEAVDPSRFLKAGRRISALG